MKKSTKSLIFRLPAEIILVVAVIASFIVKFSGQIKISWATPITLLLIVLAYFYGRHLQSKDPFEF